MPRSDVFCPLAFKLKQTTCEIISLCNQLEHFEGERLNGELVELDRIINSMQKIRKKLIEKDEHLRI